MLNDKRAKNHAHDTGYQWPVNAAPLGSLSHAEPSDKPQEAPRETGDHAPPEGVRASCLLCRQLVLADRAGAIRGPGDDEIEELCEQFAWEQVAGGKLDPTAPIQWFAGPGPHACSIREQEGALACWDRLQGNEWPAPEPRSRKLEAVHPSDRRGRLIQGFTRDGRFFVES